MNQTEETVCYMSRRPSHMECVIQAANRLRRVHAGINRKDAQELYADVWPTREDYWHINAIREDRLYVSHFALGFVPIIPKPVPVERRGNDWLFEKDGEAAWFEWWEKFEELKDHCEKQIK
jgi:hypothetical protein